MHELSLGQALVTTVLRELEERQIPAGDLRAARIAVGRLHQVVPDALTFAYEQLTRDTPAAGSKLEIRMVPLQATCPSCGWDGEIELPVFLCAKCRKAGLKLRTGLELYLEALEIDSHDDTNG